MVSATVLLIHAALLTGSPAQPLEKPDECIILEEIYQGRARLAVSARAFPSENWHLDLLGSLEDLRGELSDLQVDQRATCSLLRTREARAALLRGGTPYTPESSFFDPAAHPRRLQLELFGSQPDISRVVAVLEGFETVSSAAIRSGTRIDLVVAGERSIDAGLIGSLRDGLDRTRLQYRLYAVRRDDPRRRLDTIPVSQTDRPAQRRLRLAEIAAAKPDPRPPRSGLVQVRLAGLAEGVAVSGIASDEIETRTRCFLSAWAPQSGADTPYLLELGPLSRQDEMKVDFRFSSGGPLFAQSSRFSGAQLRIEMIDARNEIRQPEAWESLLLTATFSQEGPDIVVDFETDYLWEPGGNIFGFGFPPEHYRRRDLGPALQEAVTSYTWSFARCFSAVLAGRWDRACAMGGGARGSHRGSSAARTMFDSCREEAG